MEQKISLKTRVSSFNMMQEQLDNSGGMDASGNPILGDVGKWFTNKVSVLFNLLQQNWVPYANFYELINSYLQGFQWKELSIALKNYLSLFFALSQNIMNMTPMGL